MKTNKIYKKDARDLGDFLDKKCIDLIFFSPPYWNLRDYGYKEQIGKHDTYEEYLENMKKVFEGCFKVLKKGRYLVFNVGTVVSKEGMKFLAGDFVKICEQIGFIFRKDIIWHKPRGTTKWQRGATQFTQNPYPLMFNTNINHEYILIFQKGNTKKVNTKKIIPFSRNYIRQVCYSVWDIIPVNSPKKDERHVAPFPEELAKRIIQLLSFKGDMVLDPFCGCGTTCKMTKLLGRKFIGVDLSKEYCDLSRKKLSQITFNSLKEDIFDELREKQIKLNFRRKRNPLVIN